MKDFGIDKLFLVFFCFFLILGGVHLQNFFYSNIFFIFLLALFLIYTLKTKKKINLPHGFLVYSLFISIFVLSLFWSVNPFISLYFLSLFITGGLIWVIFYNYQKEFGKWSENLILFLGMSFLGLYLFNLIKGNLEYDSLSLFLPTTKNHNHNHLGDYWTLVLVVVLSRFIEWKDKGWLYFSFLAGFYVLLLSLSRSAMVSLLVGVFYLSKKGEFLRRRKLYLIFFLLGILFLFLYSGTKKSILLSRPYFSQAMGSFGDRIYGFGYGNFGHISRQAIGFEGNYSSYTHNLILEMFISETI